MELAENVVTLLLMHDRPFLLVLDSTQHESLWTEKRNMFTSLYNITKIYNILSIVVEGVHDCFGVKLEVNTVKLHVDNLMAWHSSCASPTSTRYVGDNHIVLLIMKAHSSSRKHICTPFFCWIRNKASMQFQVSFVVGVAITLAHKLLRPRCSSSLLSRNFVWSLYNTIFFVYT